MHVHASENASDLGWVCNPACENPHGTGHSCMDELKSWYEEYAVLEEASQKGEIAVWWIMGVQLFR